MSAGIPGLGISGLFFLLSALAMPLAGRRRRGPGLGFWLVVRQLSMAVLVIAVIVLTSVGLVDLPGPSGRGHTSLYWLPGVILAVVVCTVLGLSRAARRQHPPAPAAANPPHEPSRGRHAYRIGESQCRSLSQEAPVSSEPISVESWFAGQR